MYIRKQKMKYTQGIPMKLEFLCIKRLLNKGPSSQGYGFSSGHVWMRELNCEESWVPGSCPSGSREFEGEME